MFSRGSRLLYVFPRFMLSQCFPALHIDSMFPGISAIYVGQILPNVWP